MMKKMLLLLLVMMSAYVQAQDKLIMNDPNIAKRETSSFNAVVVRGPFKVYFSEGKENEVTNTRFKRRRLSKELSAALGIPSGAPPPWIMNM